MHLKYAKMRAIVVHKNMRLGDNTLNNQIKLFTISQLLIKFASVQAVWLILGVKTCELTSDVKQ